ncbi:MAG: cytochrome c oxidase assembly protein [Solirubrobacteraceae bacterium]
MKVSLDPGVLILLGTTAVLYLRAVRILRRRGRRTSRWQQTAFWLGFGATAAGLLSPIDVYATDLLSAHMAQHLLIADLAAPLLLTGLRSPVLLFILPKAVLVPLARTRWLRRTFHVITKPLVALPIFVATLYFWHFRFAFVGALNHDLVHVAQHASFVLASMLVWWPALEPQKMRMPGDLWKIGHIGAARLASMFLGMAFVFSKAPYYASFYGDRARDYGLTPLADQKLAGGMMMTLDILIGVFALCLFFWRASEDATRDEEREKAAQRAAANAASSGGETGAAPVARALATSGSPRPRTPPAS